MNSRHRIGVVVAAVVCAMSSTQAAAAPFHPTPDNPQWHDVSTAIAPPPMIGAAMAYDPSLGETILFGGFRADGYSDETWAWDGATWEQLHPVHSPPAQGFPTMAYDRRHDQLLMVTGYDEDAGEPRRDTWLFRNGDWSLVAQASAIADNSYLVAYDPKRHQVVCISQVNYGTTRMWTWDGSGWTQRFLGPMPPARDTAGFAWSKAHGALVLFGGENSDSSDRGTWLFDGSSWTLETLQREPKARSGEAMATLGRHVAIFGGDGYGEAVALPGTWILKKHSWRKQQLEPAPEARAYGLMSWNPSRREAVLFGGWGSDYERFDDTWTLQR